jgi:hypothetical protein
MTIHYDYSSVNGLLTIVGIYGLENATLLLLVNVTVPSCLAQRYLHPSNNLISEDI